MANSTAKLLFKNTKTTMLPHFTVYVNEYIVYGVHRLFIAIGKLYIHWIDERYCIMYSITLYVPGNFVTYFRCR